MGDLVSFAKRRGFVFQSSEIYGGISGFWDYGPLGVELKNNIKKLWWDKFVRFRQDVVGMDGAIITHPKVWKASGHIDGFKDFVLKCTKCNHQFRADHLIEKVLKIPTEGFSAKKIDSLISKHKILCTECKKGKLSETKVFNPMFTTSIGSIQDDASTAYLRPETAQLIFPNFTNIVDTTRQKLPFGIAQIGRAFRNEISVRNFIFRNREFEQMEIEYFVHPDKVKDCPFLNELKKIEFNFLSSADQQKNNKPKKISAESLAKKKLPWLAYWTAKIYDWYVTDLGINPNNLRIREHLDEELAHYASGCYDIEYNFPFGWKELNGIADRGDYDLSKHNTFSGKRLAIFDEEQKKWIVPCVAAEPSLGVERTFMMILLDAFTVEKTKTEDRRFLKLKPKLAPIQLAIFPLMKKDKLPKKAKQIFDSLSNKYICQYDETGSIGKRYRRMDEIGCPYCITIDYETIEDDTVTVRTRDSMKQSRVKIDELDKVLKF